MAMEDDEDMWANTTSPSASPPRPTAGAAGGEGGFISTALNLNSTHLHGLLSSSFVTAPSLPCHAAGNNNGGVGGGGYLNAAATPSPASSFFSAASYHHHVVDGAGTAARPMFDHDMCGAGVGGGHHAAGDPRKNVSRITIEHLASNEQ